MNSATTPILIALVVQIGLGLAVFQANPSRRANQALLIISFCAAGWLASLYFAFSATTSSAAALSVKEASITGTAILVSLNLLRISLRWGHESWRQILRRARFSLLAGLATAALCGTTFFLRGAHLSSAPGFTAPAPLYGPGGYVFAVYFVAAIVFLIVNSAQDLRLTTGREHEEIKFTLIGGILVIIFPIALTLALRPFVDPVRLYWFAPFRVVIFGAIVAYGIATRKIMEVGYLLRRTISYCILTLYLLALYGAVWWLSSAALKPVFPDSVFQIAHTVSALVIAFAMAPARGLSQTLADRLFIGARRLDFRATVSKAARILESVTTMNDLLARFAVTTAEAVGTDSVLLLLWDKALYRQRYSTAKLDRVRVLTTLASDNPIITELKGKREPLVLDELSRARATAESSLVIEQMRGLDIAIALGIFARDHLSGVMLLGPRLSGRIYGSVEQNALQVLCGQLAVAIENAELFTEVQNAKLYNETLLENLTTGVIAAGNDERITVFNNEAGMITALDPRDIIDRPLDRVPESLAEVLRETLRSGKRQENSEVVLRSEDRHVVVRASSSIFHSETGAMLGALMVLTDITALKRLELQIRRSDRLASLGTLSAGMAHEIKNPLVSIKTFAQLLPERYQDSDFRDTFSTLIGHEIDRIDSLVNQLLRFARPAKPLLKPMHVHEVLEKSLTLVGHRLYQKEIKLSRFWDADVDTIRADADQLEQVFLNFFLNAMDAMKQGGELIVATEIRAADEWVSGVSGSNGDVREVMRITVRDSGEGIRDEDIPHVFDPFFTTKDYGTGLGLSVVHGIIQEHGGQIEVESELHTGTAFHISLPLVRFHQEVAAA